MLHAVTLEGGFIMKAMSRKERERLTREEDIINAAEKIFIEKGYNEASMEQIAVECDFTRKTIYQYFSDKESLYYEVIIRGFKKLLSYFEESIKKGATGFEKLQQLSLAYYKFYKTSPGVLNLMNYVGYVSPKQANMKKHEEFNKITNLVAQTLAKTIEEGKADGSIRKDIDTMSITLSSEFLVE